MATPPTRVLSITPSVGWSSPLSPKSTPTFDVQAGDLLTLIAFAENESRTLGAPTWDGSGVWTLWQSIVILDYSIAYLYTCTVGATATARTINVAATGGARAAPLESGRPQATLRSRYLKIINNTPITCTSPPNFLQI